MGRPGVEQTALSQERLSFSQGEWGSHKQCRKGCGGRGAGALGDQQAASEKRHGQGFQAQPMAPEQGGEVICKCEGGR